MRRLEQDPEEQQEIEYAMRRQATPTHEQPTEEFDSRAVIRGLQEFGVPFGKRHVKLKDPPELGWHTTEEES